jgi:hypothetical protein
MGGEKVVAAKDDSKKNSGQLKQEQKLDNSDKGNPQKKFSLPQRIPKLQPKSFQVLMNLKRPLNLRQLQKR